MKKWLLIFFFLSLFLCGFKSSNGNDFNESNLPLLIIGETTLPEAIELLGTEPSASKVGKGGAIGYLWQYVSVRSRIFSSNVATTRKSVVLIFNGDGTFQRIFMTEGFVLDQDTYRRLVSDPAVVAEDI